MPFDSSKAWDDLVGALQSKVIAGQRQIAELQEQLCRKAAEVSGLREGLDQVERFKPKGGV